MLRAVQLTKTYVTPAGTVAALTAVDAEFRPGTLTTIVGPSGSGKSTLINLLAGFDTPTSGDVLLGGSSLASLSERGRAQLRLHRFGFVFQSFNLVAVLSAWQNVAFPLGLAGVDAGARRAKATALLARFGLEQRADHLPAKLSGGERQRVGLARALVNDPDVVFADEPTGNLDSRSGKAVLAALREVAAEGRTVIVVTHDLSIADKADAVLELLDGMVVGARGEATAPVPVTAAAGGTGA
ncbi:MAG TPA: ABC transporter ATP-binding protein [Trueperaceae bacterium]|nr:ABC transporter ATP-binding protein [Trueperaceae bacterium]